MFKGYWDDAWAQKKIAQAAARQETLLKGAGSLHYYWKLRYLQEKVNKDRQK